MGHCSYLFTITGSGRHRAFVNWKKFKLLFPNEYNYFESQSISECLKGQWSLARLFSQLLNHFKSLGYWPSGESDSKGTDYGYHFHKQWVLLFQHGIEWSESPREDFVKEEESKIYYKKEEYTEIEPRLAFKDEQKLGGDGVRVYLEVEDQSIRWYLEFSPVKPDVILGASCGWPTCATNLSKEDKQDVVKLRTLPLNQFKWLRVPFTYPLDDRITAGSVCNGTLFRLVKAQEFECQILAHNDDVKPTSKRARTKSVEARGKRPRTDIVEWSHCGASFSSEYKFCGHCGTARTI